MKFETSFDRFRELTTKARNNNGLSNIERLEWRKLLKELRRNLRKEIP